MKRVSLFSLLLFVAATLSAQSHPVSLIKPLAGTAQPSGISQANPATRGRVVETYGRLPLAFEANQGQSDPQVKFLSRGAGYILFLTQNEAVMALGPASRQKTDSHVVRPLLSRDETPAVLRMKLVGANAETKVFGQDELPGKTNYFVGKDPQKWQTSVPTYAKVRYEGIYPGIDLLYYGNQRQLEYDFIVAPGADARRIEFDLRGAKSIRRDERGELVFTMGEDEIRWHKPVVYQERNGARQLIAAHYSITDKDRIGFEVAAYDADRPLYIDPLVYSTYLGGSSTDQGQGIAVDGAGNAYIVGSTSSTNFPATNPLQPGNAGRYDVFVAKINPTGSALIYSTYLGGTADDHGNGIAIDSAGNAYIIGSTDSTDFPTQSPFQASNHGGFNDAFVAKLNPEGSALVYSTYLGGTGFDTGSSIALDSSGSAYVIGTTGSTDFPTQNPFQPTKGGVGSNAFVARINPAGSALVYATYLGGSSPNSDQGTGIAVDSAGSAYVTGLTSSTDFPTKNALQPAFGGSDDISCPCDAFVSKINSSGSLVYSTYLGGSGPDVGSGIAVDAAGSAYVTGQTNSVTDFPITPGAFQTTTRGWAAFVTKLNPQGSALVYSSFLGEFLIYPGGSLIGGGIAVDALGNAYVTGSTSSRFFPLVNPFQKRVRGNRAYNAFVSKLNPSGSGLFFSSYLGGGQEDNSYGIAVDASGAPSVTGGTTSTNFLTRNPLQPTYGGGSMDAFVSKIDVRVPTKISLSSSPNPSTFGQAITFTAVVTSIVGAPADGETVTFMVDKTMLFAGSLSGGSASFTTSTLKVGAHVVKAVYGGESNFFGSKSTTLTQIVNMAPN